MTAPRHDGRDSVLSRIRLSLGRSGPVAAIPPLPGSAPCPLFDGDPVERFVAKMREKAASIERLAGLDAVGAAVQRFVAAAAAPPRIRIAGALAGLAWPAGLTVLTGAALREDTTSVTPCFAAVAESGTVAMLSGPDTPITLNFVPDNHVVVVRVSQVLPHLEDLWALHRASGQPMPRAVNLISGPSRTADIEQTIQLGAHGPRRLHVLLVDG